MDMSSCPESWRPFEGKGTEAAGGAAQGGASASQSSLKAKLNIFSGAKCSAGAGLKCFQRK